MKLIMDTSFLLELKRGNKRAINLLREESESASDIGISILTLYELLVGSIYLLLKNGDLRERLWLDEILKWVSIYSLDEDSVKRAAEIRARGMVNGEAIPDMDLLIATSVGGPAKLLTCDEDHERIKKLLDEIGIHVIYVSPRARTKAD